MNKSETREFTKLVAVSRSHPAYAARGLAALHRAAMRNSTKAAIDAVIAEYQLAAHLTRVNGSWV